MVVLLPIILQHRLPRDPELVPLSRKSCGAQAAAVEGPDQRPDQDVFSAVVQAMKERAAPRRLVRLKMQPAQETLDLREAALGREDRLPAECDHLREARVMLSSLRQQLHRSADE